MKNWTPNIRNGRSGDSQEEKKELLNNGADKTLSVQYARPRSSLFLKIATALRITGVVYVCIGLVCFAVGLFWRTQSYFSLLGPIAVFSVVFVSSEYYNMKRKGWLTRLECERNTQTGFTHQVLHSCCCCSTLEANKSPPHNQ